MRRILLFLLLPFIMAGCATDGSMKTNGRSRNELLRLSWSEFQERTFNALLERTPELLTELGLDKQIDVPGLNRYDPGYLDDTEALERFILETALAFDESRLSREERREREIYLSWLKTNVKGHPYRYHEYLVNPSLVSVNFQTELFFTESLPVNNGEDAIRYIDLLNLVYPKMERVIAFMDEQEKAGVILPDFLMGPTLVGIRTISEGRTGNLSFHKAFAEKVNGLELPRAEKDRLIAACLEACERSVKPGYALLYDRLRTQREKAPDEPGAAVHPDGDAFYQWCAARHSGGDSTPTELHKLGLEEGERLEQAIREKFARLGYDGTQPLEQLYAKLARENGSVSAGNTAGLHRELADKARVTMGKLFTSFPKSSLQIKTASPGGYYLSPPLDGSRPGIFFAFEGSAPRYGLPTLTYHETLPGHHYQISLAREGDLPLFRRQVLFTGYAEGWALYSERLMAESGAYEEDPAGELGYLQAQAFRAARLVMDTGLHVMGWTPDKAATYLQEKSGHSYRLAMGQVYRYLAWPGQAVSYYSGYVDFLDLREKAKERRGDGFSLKGFHDELMEAGPMPPSLMEELAFPPRGAALLIIDVQKAYVPYLVNKTTMINNIVLLKEKARSQNAPVVYIRHVGPDTREGTRGWEFDDRIKPDEGDVIVEKSLSDGFSLTDLDAVLEELNVKTLVLTGLGSTACYSATAGGAKRNGYRPVIVSDAHGDVNRTKIKAANGNFSRQKGYLIRESEQIDYADFLW